MKKIGVVILHYNEKALSDTFECVESLEKIKNSNVFIVVVENGSNDSSARLLKEKYIDREKIEIVISKKNLGFAKGNNLGIKYLIENQNPDLVVVLNNDTYISQQDFFSCIEEEYEEENFDILGPYIFDKNNKPQNPVNNLVTSINEINSSITRIERRIKNIYSLKNKISIYLREKIKEKIIFEKIIRFLIGKNKKNPNQKYYNIGLHGSAVIFSKKYYERFPEVFYKETFMYREEDILYYRVLKYNLKSVYSPKIQVYHKEDSSTEAIMGKNIKKHEFCFKESLKSLEIYKNAILNDEI